jgi:hypothetical protein
MPSELLDFAAYPAPVRVRLDAGMRPMIASLLKGWSISDARNSSDAPQLEVLSDRDRRLTVRGPWVGPDYSLSDPVDGACGFIAEALKVQANETSNVLCVHAAGVVLGGRAVLFPAGFRAGKSVLTAVLASRGERIIADDATLISPEAGVAISPGISPRLRLPVPHELAGATVDFVGARMRLHGRRYGYLTLPEDRLMTNGESAPIGAFVYLNRRPGGVDLVEMPKSEALKTLIWQNFARRIPAGQILSSLSALVAGRPTLELRYSDAEAAADLLQRRFAVWPAVSLQTAGYKDLKADHGFAIDQPSWRAGPNIVERQFDGGHFIADEHSGRILHLNATAAAVWRLLSAGEAPSEVASLLGAAFPEVDPGRIGEDVATLAQCFRENGLLVRADAHLAARR